MFRWNLMLRSLFGSRRQQPKARRQQTVKLNLEALEDRALLSVSAANPLATVAVNSSSLAAEASTLRSVLNQWGQWVATVQQDISSSAKALGQTIAQGIFAVEQQWARFLGFDPNVQASTDNAPSGTGSDSNSSTGHSASTLVTPHAPSPSSPATPKTPPPDSGPPPQEYVYLSSSTYSVNESAGTVAVQVNLFTATSSTVSVELTSSNGTATSGIDYSGINTEVVFQPETTSQTVNIPILDDGTGDDSVSSESFTVQLSNATGALIQSPSSATVTIQENSSPPPPPPPPPPFPGGVVSGTVWLDNDADGIMQIGEPGMAGIGVQLWGLSTTYLGYEDSTTTDANGNYQFTIPPGPIYWTEFQVVVYPPPGDEGTIEDASSTGVDSDVNAQGISNWFVLNANGEAEIDAGLLPAQGASDTLVWNPGAGSDNNASTVANWYDQTLGRQLLPGDPGPGAGTLVIFDGTPNTALSKNAPINWIGGDVESIRVRNGYNAQMTVDGDTDLTDEGWLEVDSTSTLNVQFAGSTTFLVKSGGDITNMNLTGGAGNFFYLAGGTMNIADSSIYTENLGVNLTIQGEATLIDEGFTKLNLSDIYLTITVNGEMDLLDGVAKGATLIQGPNQYAGGDYIDVNGGTLKYLPMIGYAGGTDTINYVPILVENSGTVSVSTGWLNVTGHVSQTRNVNVYTTGGSILFSNGATLECDDAGYIQSDGVLETMDTSKCTFQVGSPTIYSGWLVIDTQGATYGELDFQAEQLTLYGTLGVTIQGYTSGNPAPSDLLKVVGGTVDLTNKATLALTVIGTVQKDDKWMIIGAKSIIGDFSSVSIVPNINLVIGPPNASGEYWIKYNG